MKTLMKISMVAAVALALTTFGTPKAQAGVWFPGRVLGGVVVGAAIGVSVAAAHAPYYVYPGYGYPGVYAACPPVYYGPPAVVYGAPYRYGYGYAYRGGRGGAWGCRHSGYRR